MSQVETSYEAERQRKVDELRALGFDPYGNVNWPRHECIARARALHDPAMESTCDWHLSGRVMLRRMMGKLCFLTIAGHDGTIQFGLSRNRLPENLWQLVERIDLGDLVSAKGKLGSTKTGEITLWATDFRLTAKALVPPPSKMEGEGLKNIELRYRNRHVDLWSNPEVMQTMKMRSEIISLIRHCMEDEDFLEVETPVLQSIAGGATARPFQTHHNTFNQDMFLRIAPELFLKRCLIGGMERVFEIGKNFRNEGVSPRHNPEFTAIEGYAAYSDYVGMMNLLESMIRQVVSNLPPGKVGVMGKEWEGEGSTLVSRDVFVPIRFDKPWRRVSFYDLLNEYTDRTTMVPVDLVGCYETCIEPTLIEPTFVTNMPANLYPLAKAGPVHGGFIQTAAMFELVIGGQEVGCGYTEQNDPAAQLAAFEKQGTQIDTDFVEAMKVGMPPAGGFGIGLDRLVAILTGQASIRDVILFPTFRTTNPPEKMVLDPVWKGDSEMAAELDAENQERHQEWEDRKV